MEDEVRFKQTKKFEEKDLEALLDNDFYQPQEELAEFLGQARSTFKTFKKGRKLSKARKFGDIWIEDFFCKTL